MFLIVNLYTLHKVGQQDDNSYKIVFAKSNNNSSVLHFLEIIFQKFEYLGGGLHGLLHDNSKLLFV